MRPDHKRIPSIDDMETTPAPRSVVVDVGNVAAKRAPLRRQPTIEDTDGEVRDSPDENLQNTSGSPEHPRRKFFRKLRLFRMPARRVDSSTSEEDARTPLRSASFRFTRSLLSGKSSNESNLTQRTRLPTSDSEWEDERKKSIKNGLARPVQKTSLKKVQSNSGQDERRDEKPPKVSKKQIEEFLDELSSGSYHSSERPSQIYFNNKATGRTYRSQSVFSADPSSPYYVSKGVESNDNVRRSPSVSCVLEILRREQREAELKGIVIPPGISLAAFDKPKVSTIRQHYYPEGGWGWVICSIAVFIHFLVHGIYWSFPLLILRIRNQFKYTVDVFPAVCLGAMSMAVSLFCSPWVVGVCRRKSTRLLAVLGGLVAALAVLFTSFASQFHQLFISYGLILGCGISMTRDCSVFMVGQYFKKRRELVELILATGTGTGISVMPIFIIECIRSIGWRLGLQALTGIVFSTFILGIFYRPASLYHPQRRAILHLKSMQKRSKAKDKNPAIEKVPFFDFGVLKSRTVQILITGTAIAAVGVSSPMILFIYQAEEDGLSRSSLLYLQVFLGLSFILGSLCYGCIIVNNPENCHIARQYLCQGACALLGASMLLCTTIHDYSGYLTFVWCYGSFYGAYLYSLKMYTLEKVRARNFAKAWGFIQCAQAIPILIGPPITTFLNEYYGDRRGYFLSAGCAFFGAFFLFLIDVHKRTRPTSAKTFLKNKLGERDCRRCSDAPNGELVNGLPSRRSSVQDSIVMFPRLLQSQRSLTFSNYADLRRQELTCISEEAIMDNLLEDLIDDCITSCNKEEKYLMLSEYENNLTKAASQEIERRTRIAQASGRRGSLQGAPIYDPQAYGCDHCPNCMRLVETSPPVPRRASPRRSLFHRPSQAAICSVDVIEEVTSSM